MGVPYGRVRKPDFPVKTDGSTPISAAGGKSHYRSKSSLVTTPSSLRTKAGSLRLEREVLELRQDLEACRAEAKESAEHANMANFQNQLLLDMLAVARADEGKLKARLGQETARHAELGRSLEHAYTKIIEAGLDPGVSEAP
eukprot:jgi/Undpi1/1434/HiC_scaffold_11.g04825.m1